MSIAVSIVCNQVIPYRIPVFNALAREPDLDVEVVYISKAEKNRKWKVDDRLLHKHVLLPSISAYVTARDWPVHLHWGLGKALENRAPDVTVTMGYDSPAFWQTLAWARRCNAAHVLYFGSTALSSRTTRGIVDKLRRRYIRDTDAFLAYGSWAQDYLIQLGARWQDIFPAVNTVDVAGIAENVAAATPIQRGAGSELLFIGQLIERKGLDILIKGLYRLPHRDWRLHVVGDGPDEPRLRRLVKRKELQGHVLFHGYKQKSELYPYLAGCDILVMPSHREVWGLVINEALAAGMFVVAGQTAGCARDIIHQGVNGMTIDTRDEAHIASVMEQAMRLPKDRRMLQKSILSHTPQVTAQRLGEAIRHAAAKRATGTAKATVPMSRP